MAQDLTTPNGKIHRLWDDGRVRDVHNGPDGHLYVILNGGRRTGPSGIYRLVPVE